MHVAHRPGGEELNKPNGSQRPFLLTGEATSFVDLTENPGYWPADTLGGVGLCNQKRLLQRVEGRSAGREDPGCIFPPCGVAKAHVKSKSPASEEGGSISQAGSQLPFP